MIPLIKELINATEARVKAQIRHEAAKATGLEEIAQKEFVHVSTLIDLEQRAAAEIQDYIDDLSRMNSEGGA